jgi:hypothetical protein
LCYFIHTGFPFLPFNPNWFVTSKGFLLRGFTQKKLLVRLWDVHLKGSLRRRQFNRETSDLVAEQALMIVPWNPGSREGKYDLPVQILKTALRLWNPKIG